MAPRPTVGGTPFERIRERYENTEKQCPECGYVGEGDNWTSQTDGRRIVYHYTCPVCGAEREHVFEVGR
jgi:rubredoxin